MSYKKNPKSLSQFQFCEENGVPLAIVIASSEKETNTVKLRVVENREEVSIPRENMVEEIKRRLMSMESQELNM